MNTLTYGVGGGEGWAEVCLDMKKGRREGKQADGRLPIGIEIGIGREGGGGA